MGSCLNKQP